jgi:hypothetical protein
LTLNPIIYFSVPIFTSIFNSVFASKFAALADAPDALVATPGRLMHLLAEVGARARCRGRVGGTGEEEGEG